jgi:predicted dehydrogenase
VRVTSSWDASTGLDAEIRLRIYGERGNLELTNRSGSFYDFDARLCRGTAVEHLGSDDGDGWQAGPLLAWLARVAADAGYAEPDWIRETAAVIDDAYALERTRRMESTVARGTVHVLGKKGVVP